MISFDSFFASLQILFRLSLIYSAHQQIICLSHILHQNLMRKLNNILISIHKSFNYNYQNYRSTHNNTMDKESLQQTLRKSREVEERYKKFLQEKAQSDKQWIQTQAKINRTLDKLSETKDTIKKIDELYENYQKSFQNAINTALSGIQVQRLLQIPDPDFVPKNGTPKQIGQLMKNKKKVVFMTGAGVSAASGIPTFRDKDGYWTKKKLEGISPEQFLTFMNFEKDPFCIWEWLQDFYCTKSKCKPNIGHVGIDIICNKLLNKKGQVIVVTQNIDNLHNQATSKQKTAKKYPIYEVHGNILYVRCDNCSKDQPKMVCFPYTQHRNTIKDKKIPKCPKCSSSLRPHIMFFDEFYQQKFHHSESVKQFEQTADLLIVIGTALQTGLARLTVESFLLRKVDIVEINMECTIKQKNVIWMQGKSDEILHKISNYL